ncbi:DUF2779 domain-containing protein [Brachymonas denitrificans]|uniref:DUF2779 domain-containing protein n=1 Tax=Brachymonas denitrificans TaxID=28220 RepID=UPI001BD0038C|nr:DUF2779 domain-containing protein [Brachymonas denitrificans]
MRTLSKSKLLAYRQCPKRLWLEIHRPELREDSAATQATFATGHEVGDKARSLYDPDGKGALIDLQLEGFDAAFARTQSLLQSFHPIFEAGFKAAGAMAFADVLLPVDDVGRKGWRMVEVKSSTSVKDYYRDDAAIQSFIARAAGVPLTAIALAHIDSSWTYPGNQDYRRLLVEEDLTDEAFARGAEVREWIQQAQQIAESPTEPEVGTGSQCTSPYACGFSAYCTRQEPVAEYPIAWLPGQISSALREHIALTEIIEMADAPDDMLSDKQRRVKTVTLSGEVHFDQTAASQALAPNALPAYFMDFETIQFAVPIWKGTRPYQQIPFQFSVQQLNPDGRLKEHAFLELSGEDPSEPFCRALLAACGVTGPIYVYNAGFENSRMRDLAQRFPQYAEGLDALIARVVDLLPVARTHYYHPSQQGSWSIKAVLPAACPELSYDNLDGVQDGGMAQDAFLQALAPETEPARKAELERQLLAYCGLDTYAMLKLWSLFTNYTAAGQTDA